MKDTKEQPTPPARRPNRQMFEDVVRPPDITKLEATALQALANGEANPAQQKMALDWIVLFAAATYDETYRPEKVYDTIFANGRASVGRHINRALKLNISKLED